MRYTVGQVNAMVALFVTVFTAFLVWVTYLAFGENPFAGFIGSTVEAVQSLSSENPLVALTSEARELRGAMDARNAALYEASLDMDGFEPVP